MASITTIASGDAITDSRAVLNTNFSNLNTDKAETASPTLVTPVLGVATATSINKVTITQPATTATLTIVEGGSLITAGAYAITLTATGSTGVTLPTAGTLMANVVEDTTPQLGGNLDVNGNSIVSASAGDIAITPDTTGDLILDALKWPQADGSASQFLQTDGGGQLVFATPAASSATSIVLSMRKGSAGTLTKGQPVYLSGWNASGYAEVELADANDATKMPAITIADQDITNAATASVVVYGNMTGMVTNTFSVGDSLYVAADSTLTATRPATALDAVQSVGTVIRSHASLGVIQITGAGRSNAIPNKMSDAHFRVCDDADATALMQLDASGLTTGTTRTYVLPDADLTLVGTATTQTLSAKTLTAPAITGAATLAENASLALDPAGSADGKYSGITIAGTGGATISFGEVVYLAVADSRWEKTDASAAATGAQLTGICVLASTDGAAITVLLKGTIRADAAFPALTVGAPVYMSETAGAVVNAAPTTTDAVVRTLGFGLTANEMYWDCSPDYITHT